MSCLNILKIFVLFLSFSGPSFPPRRMSSFIIAEGLQTAAFGSKIDPDLDSLFPATSEEVVRGSVNGRLTLPCANRNPICWARGDCFFSSFSCNDEITRTDGQHVTWSKSDRYQLLGNISQGDVSLTITGVTKEDEGIYCCRTNVKTAFDSIVDKKAEKEVKVEITEEVVRGSVNGRLTLTCASKDAICWERGSCSILWCNNGIIWTDGQKMTSRKSERYQLLGNISQGDVSLTITGSTKEDEGTYCCRKDPAFAFDKGKKVEVRITEDPEVRVLATLRSERIKPTIPKATQPTTPKATQPTIPKKTQPTSPKATTNPSTTEVMVVTKSLDVGGRKTASIGNIIRGILIFLLPILFLLIFKCCSL